jgi:hypothetical protein
MTGRHRPQGVPLRLPRYRRPPRLSPEAPQLVSPAARKQRRWPVWSAEVWGPRARYPCHQPGCCTRRIPRLCPPARVPPPRLRRPCQRRRRRPRAPRPLLVRARPARPPPVLLPSSALPVTSGYPRRPGSWPRRPPRTRLGPPWAARSGLPGRSRPLARQRLRPRPRPARRPPSLPGQHHLLWPRPPLLRRNPPRRCLGPVRAARRPPGVPRHVPIPPPPPARPRGRVRLSALKTGGPCRP